MPFLHKPLARLCHQTLGLFLEKMKPLSLISFELLVASCMIYEVSIIMIHDNSMHTLHTIYDHSKISQITRNVWQITT